jgi:hypothetical protein
MFLKKSTLGLMTITTLTFSGLSLTTQVPVFAQSYYSSEDYQEESDYNQDWATYEQERAIYNGWWGDDDSAEYYGDSADYYQVELIGGVDYVASAFGAANAGGTLQDPYLVLYDSAGNPIALEDNSFGLGSDPLLQFQAPTSGTYFVGVSDNVGSGTYTFELAQAGEPIFFGDP